MIKPDYFRIYWHRRANNCGWQRDRFDKVPERLVGVQNVYRKRRGYRYKFPRYISIGGTLYRKLSPNKDFL